MDVEWELVIDEMTAEHQQKVSELYQDNAELEEENQQLKVKLNRKQRMVINVCKRYNGLLKKNNRLEQDKKELVSLNGFLMHSIREIRTERTSLVLELSDIMAKQQIVTGRLKEEFEEKSSGQEGVRKEVALIQLGLNALRNDFELMVKENEQLKEKNKTLEQEVIDLKQRLKCKDIVISMLNVDDS